MNELPDSIGPYKIIDKIGQGGFATVYLAHPSDKDALEKVALKVLNSRENYGRFRREIETVAKLDHPNIIRIFDTGEDEETKVPFYSMEYIPTGTLFDRLASDHRLPRTETVEIIKKIGIALTYPHQQGIIHRDVNPKNILLDTRHQPARPVLTDFGLVKPLGTEGSQLTETMALIGTFAYYAPEQWNKEDLGPATDVYALAITFYEMLAGERPYNGDVFSLREKHLYEPLPPLSTVAPAIGSFFDEVLSKATAKNAADRYQNISSFIEAIEAANEQAEQAEKIARRERAIKVIRNLQQQMQGGSNNFAQTLDTIESALGDYPDYGQALWLRGKIRVEQGQIAEALPDFELAYQQMPNPSSEVGHDYLAALKEQANILWQRNAYSEALEHLATIRQMLDKPYENTVNLTAWRDTWSELVESHHKAGQEAYANGNPQDINAAMDALEQEIEALQALNAADELKALQQNLLQLQVNVYHSAGLETYAGGTPPDIDQAVKTLAQKIELLKNLQAQAEATDLQAKLAVLQQTHGQKDEQYQEILSLMDKKQYLQALACLDQTFIRTGDYEYRDAAELLWKLVYAKQHNNTLPVDPQLTTNNHNKFEQQYQINQYLIPVAMVIAILVGGLAAPQLQTLPALPVITAIAWVLFIAYFGYYVWVYYINK